MNDQNAPISSTPNLNNFIPLPEQWDLINDIRKNFDYAKNGTYEVLMSGSVGSAKSLPMAHIIVTHCIQFPGAVAGLGRLALPRLKETLCQKIREHLFELGGGLSYSYNETSGAFKFNNGSRCVPFSWSDKNYQKFRSYELSMMAIEELSENKGDHWSAYIEAYQRVGRLSHVPEKLVIAASNPDSPSHPAYKHFIENGSEQRRVYYSKTSDNPYLPSSYIHNLRATLDPKMARRMIDGEWIEIQDEVVYYAYQRENNFRDYEYKVDKRYPICIAFDFNIAKNKPLSVAFLQHIRGQTHVFNEVVIEGARTRDACQDALDRGLIDDMHRYIIHGDATGKHNDTRNIHNDYEIIENFLEGHGIDYEMDVPRKNPPVRERHNLVNGRICNSIGQRNLFVYKDAPTADEGFRLTALKNGAQWIEDDSKSYQHITTSIGYSVCQDIAERDQQGSRTVSTIGRYG